MRRSHSSRLGLSHLVGALILTAGACDERRPIYDAREPGRGPGVLAGNGVPITNGDFPGGDDVVPAPLPVTPPLGPEPPDCDASCRTYCAERDLDNPVNRGVCTSLWGVGLGTRPIATAEACRRLFADTVGRFPDAQEIATRCASRPWGAVVRELIASDEFVALQRRRWADRLLYNNEALSVARIYDMDVLVDKLYRGLVPYDQFAALLSAHPVVTRRYATSEDRAEAVFRILLGRPPFSSERSDLARLYALWDNGYYDHPSFGRSPDSYVRFRCLDDEGRRDPDSVGECTSILWGYHELVLEPDARADDEGRLWSGLLTAEEWDLLSLPGKILARQPGLWERAVDDVVEQYLGYPLTTTVPTVREALVDHLLAFDGDIRSVHHAVLTSAVYLQSAAVDGPDPVAESYRHTSGPLKQAEVETWLDTVEGVTDRDIGSCDFRLPDPGRILEMSTIGGYALVSESDWTWRDDGERIDTRYRDLARSLGGCPENLAGGRFKTVSILTTATQEAFVTTLCNPSLIADTNPRPAPVEALLPSGMAANRELTLEVARDVARHQVGRFFGREPALDELALVDEAAEACAPKPCTAEAFARPLCFALLSGAEMLFY
ncbi:MAG: hypothetical protein IT385_00755 [Deltaproteobacteria bacterium]|nr:hypothetical protein [Deltaproteobacteria bacterium]